MNQTKRKSCGIKARSIATFAPSTNSILPPAGFGAKYNNGLRIMRPKNGAGSVQPHSLGIQSKICGMQAEKKPTRLGATTGQRGGSSHFM